MSHPTEPMDEILERLRVGESSALEDLRILARDNPEYPDAWAHLAWNLYGLGFAKDAHTAAVHLVKLLPENPEVHRLYAQACFCLGLMDETLAAMRESVRRASEPFSYRLELIETLLRIGCPWAAWREYVSVWSRKKPEQPMPNRLWIRILANLAVSGLARLIFVSAVREWILGWGYRFCAKRNRWQAAAIISRVASTFETNKPVWSERVAEALYRKRDYLFPEFETEIAWRTVSVKFGVPQAVVKLARAHLHAGHVKIAVQLLEHESPLSPEGKEILAHGLAAVGRHEEAVALYKEAGLEQPIHFVNAGIVQLQDRNDSQAADSFESALQADPDHPLARFLHSVSELLSQGVSLDAGKLDSLVCELAGQHNWQNRICEQRDDWNAHTKQLLQSRRYRIVACPNCSSQRFRPTYLDRMADWIRGRCEECGFLFVNPQPLPETLAELYTNETVQAGQLQRFFRRTLDELLVQPPEEVGKMLGRKERWWEPEFSLALFEEERGKNRTLLDVGCSVGALMYQYRCRGWREVGIDLDPNGVELAKSKGLEARAISLEEANFSPGSFDLITMMDVIEHVPDPRTLIRKVYDLLRPGGILKLKTPCAESIVHYFYGPDWISNDTHLLYFSRRILRDCLEQAGFEIPATRSYLEANKLSHTYDGWRRLSVTPLFDPLVLEWNIGDTLLALGRKSD